MAAQRQIYAVATTESEIKLGYDARYRPFLLDGNTRSTDWISELELDTATKMAQQDLRATSQPLRVLVLYGSLRKRSWRVAHVVDRRSYSKLMAFEASRILHRLGCDVRVFDPAQLPVKNDLDEKHDKVQELRELSRWSDGHTGVFKNQIDWIPLSAGSVRPTQGRTLAIIQVNGGSQSFNAVNSLRILGRWMRMFCIPNQSSLPKAYTQFTDEGDETSRLLPSGNRDRLVDCMEEFVKYTIAMRPHFELFGDRYSERTERRAKAAEVAAAAGKTGGVGRNGLNKLATAEVDQSRQSDGTGNAGAVADVVNGVNLAGI